MADMAKKSIENINVSGDGPVYKSELRSILNNAYVEVPTEANAITEVFEVLEINTTRLTNQEEVVGRYIYSQHGDAETFSFKPANSNIVQYPMVGELWLGFGYKGQNYYLSRLSDDEISVNYQKVGESDKVVSPGVDNTKVKTKKSESLTKEFGVGKVDINPIPKFFDEGETLIQGRFNNYLSIGSDFKSQGMITISNSDTSTLAMMTLDNPTTELTTGDLFITADNDINISGSNDVNIFGENNISITNNSGDGDIRIGNAKAQDLTIVSQRQRIISLRSTQINSSNGEIEIGGGRRDNPLPPAVLGNKDFIKIMDLILSTNISSKSVELATEAAQPTPNPITIESLTKEIADLKNIKDERTYLSKKVSIE